MLCHEPVWSIAIGVGRVLQASCSGQVSRPMSFAFGLQGAGLPDLNLHNLFGQSISLYSSPSHLLAFSPSPEQAGPCLGCFGLRGIC